MRLARALLAAAAASALLAASAATATAAPPDLDGAYIVVLASSAGSTDAATDELERRRGFRARLRFRRALRGFAARLTDGQAARLREDPEVASVTPDLPVKALGEVGLAQGDSAPMGVRRLAAATATTTREASTANVAVIDSGIDLAHSDLNARDGINCVTPGKPAMDDDGHGTHVAGSIAAVNDGRGVVGVAPGTAIRAVKVLDAEGNGSFSQIICGIDWVTATRTDPDPSNDISVANLSLGGTGASVGTCAGTADPLHMAICASTLAGVTYVVAAGNDARAFDATRRPDVPAAYPEVLTVTAMSDSDGRPGAAGAPPTCRAGEVDDAYATFSNYAVTSAGAGHTVAAPGVCIRSTWPGGGDSTISGTSMAAPHIAGAVALCLGERGTAGPCAGLTPSQIIAKIRETAAAQEPGFGYAGDPGHPIAGSYFGALAWAGIPPAPTPVEEPPPVSDDPPTGDAIPPVPVSPTPTPSPTPSTTRPAAPAPVVPAARPVADTVGPTTAVAIPRRRLGTVLRRGLAAALRPSEACVATAEVWLSGRTARRVRLSRGAKVRIARRAGIRLTAGTRKTVVLRLTRAARARLARVGRLTVTVKVTATDASGNRRTVQRTAVLRR